MKLSEHYENTKETVLKHYYQVDEQLFDMIYLTYIVGGHVLIEGPPGTGKTHLAKIFSQVLGKNLKRIQFTSDLLPADIIGSSLYSPSTHEFKFIEGPVFSDVLLGDEINRTPPRTQSALLEAMEEKQVSIEGVTRKLSENFFVIATQNPFEYEGTYPLPEAQLDRFMIFLNLDHGGAEENKWIMNQHLSGNFPVDYSEIKPLPVDINQIRLDLQEVKVDQSLVEFVANVLDELNSDIRVSNGSSVRGGISILSLARGKALAENREFVTPDDLKIFIEPVLKHRIELAADADLSGETKNQVIESIVQKIGFPV